MIVSTVPAIPVSITGANTYAPFWYSMLQSNYQHLLSAEHLKVKVSVSTQLKYWNFWKFPYWTSTSTKADVQHGSSEPVGKLSEGPLNWNPLNSNPPINRKSVSFVTSSHRLYITEII